MNRMFGRIAAVIAAGTLVMVAGCGSSSDEPGTPSKRTDTADAPSRSESDTRSTSDTPSPSEEPTPEALQAADGEDVSACADTRCEVIVRAGAKLPVPTSTDLENLRVVKVTENEVVMKADLIGNSSFGSCLGGVSCDVKSINGKVDIRLGPDSRGAQNGVVLTVTDIADGEAVLEVTPAS